jgi:hypothetical protein
LLAGETLWKIKEDLGFTSVPALRYTLQNKWWIGIRTRTHKIVGQVWNSDSETWVGGKRVPHDTPIEVETNLGKGPLVTPEMFERVQQVLEMTPSKMAKRETPTIILVRKGPKHRTRGNRKPLPRCAMVSGLNCPNSSISDRREPSPWRLAASEFPRSIAARTADTPAALRRG